MQGHYIQGKYHNICTIKHNLARDRYFFFRCEINIQGDLYRAPSSLKKASLVGDLGEEVLETVLELILGMA